MENGGLVKSGLGTDSGNFAMSGKVAVGAFGLTGSFKTIPEGPLTSVNVREQSPCRADSIMHPFRSFQTEAVE